MEQRIRVLVVDDSAFARTVMRRVLEADTELEVLGTARDGLDALEKIAELSPDVVTLDLVMPELDGVGVLRALAAELRPPRVVIVTMTDMETRMGVEALAAGAFDVVHKPTALATDRLYELGAELIEKVKVAGRLPRVDRTRATVPPAPPSPHSPSAPSSPSSSTAATRSDVAVVVIGASAGGPQAIARLLRALPGDFGVPIAVALHMPPGYTEAYAERVGRDSALRVVEAEDGARIRPGEAVIGRGGMHLKIERVGDAVRARLDVRPVESPYKPSVDVLFASAAASWGHAALGVVLTGMGHDGLEGARALRAAQARVLVESEESCVVYGMPRAVEEAGLATAQAPLEEIPSVLLSYLRPDPRR